MAKIRVQRELQYRVRISRHIIDDLVKSIMLEILAAARACGHALPEDLPDLMIRTDPIDVEIKPSLLQYIEKGNLLEIETIVKQPRVECEPCGVPEDYVRDPQR